MSKTWYPKINYENCVECGACVEHCSHGVYNKEKSPRPEVINPDNCVEGCKGCGSLCPVEAIEYFGDTGNNESNGFGCNTNCCCGDQNTDSDVENEVNTKSCCESGCGCGE